MKYYFSILILFFSLPVLLNSQSIITGKLIDSQNNEALIQATVSVDGTEIGTVTDIDGNYQLSLNAGKYTLQFRYVGYQPESKEIEVDGINPMVLDVMMRGELVSDVVIITEGKYEKKLEQSTVSIDVINAAQIQRNNVRSLEDIVSKVSGVQIMDGQVSIRGGAGYAYGAGSRVSFLVDGQLLLSAELSDVKWNFVPIENAEQIEVIKGSASVLYGSGALNGVINVRTAYPTAKPYTSFSTYAGIYDQPPVDSMRWYDPKADPMAQPGFYGMFFAHREKIKKNFDLVIGGNFHFENGYIKQMDERRFRFNFNTKYVQPDMDGRLSYGVNGNIMYHEQGTYFLAQDMRNNAYRNVSEGGRDRYVSTTVDPFITFYDPWKNKHDFRGRWFLISKQRGPNPSIGHLFNGEYQFQRNFEGGWLLTSGLMGQHFQANSILFNNNNDPEKDRAKFMGSSFAIFSQLEKKFFDRLTVVAGVRWEGFLIDSVFTPMSYPLPRLGLNYQVTKNDFIRFSFGSGFRFPSLAERFINEPIPIQGFSIGAYPNPDIKPEIGYSTELAYRRTYRTSNFKMHGDIALFWMEYRNMVEFVLGLYPEGLGFKSLNISQARIAGWEISGQTDGFIGKTPLRIWGGYTFTYPGDMQDDTLQRKVAVYLGNMFNAFAHGINPDSASDIRSVLRYRSMHNVRFDIETEWKGFTFGASANYNSHIHKIDLVFALGLVSNGIQQFRKIHNKGSLIFDWRFGYKFNEKQHLNFIVNNLLNTEYASRPAKMGAPRTFSLKYTHVF
jgi:iron complex outermembrane receptor protein